MENGTEDGEDVWIKIHLGNGCYDLVACRSVLVCCDSFQVNKAGLTCGTPRVRSGCGNGNNGAEFDEQVKL